MQKLSNIQDPYDKEPFKIEYPEELTPSLAVKKRVPRGRNRGKFMSQRE
jgi:hypothetical protein